MHVTWRDMRAEQDKARHDMTCHDLPLSQKEPLPHEIEEIVNKTWAPVRTAALDLLHAKHPPGAQLQAQRARYVHRECNRYVPRDPDLGRSLNSD